MQNSERLKAFEEAAYLFLRLVVGVIMVVHGWGKLTDFDTWSGHVHAMGLPLPWFSAWLGVAGEFLGGLGVLVGALTRIAAFGVACTMAVAVFGVHLSHGLLAKNNGFEYPLTLLAAAIFIMAKGSGRFGVDAFFCKQKEAP